MTIMRICTVSDYLQPATRELEKDEIIEVSSEIAHKVYATTMLLTYNDGGDCIELVHNDLMAVIHGLSNDMRTLCKVLDNEGAAQ